MAWGTRTGSGRLLDLRGIEVAQVRYFLEPETALVRTTNDDEESFAIFLKGKLRLQSGAPFPRELKGEYFLEMEEKNLVRVEVSPDPDDPFSANVMGAGASRHHPAA